LIDSQLINDAVSTSEVSRQACSKMGGFLRIMNRKYGFGRRRRAGEAEEIKARWKSEKHVNH
jgi:hypothetical protein